ncbi:MAG: 4-hydroxy-tetrahydrodipicolinate reductase [Chitinophagales bacterium]|nr:4-hydroxy-tetrahydrodipicolinate reductase [Chitinophagales bacterium]
MKIVLFGHGRMGRLVEQEAQSAGDQIVQIITTGNRHKLTTQDLQPADAAIDFTTPDAAVANAFLCLQAGLPVVIGTTGWYDALPLIEEECKKHQGSVLYGSNFSPGMNMVFVLNRHLARMMRGRTEFAPRIWERHHQAKKDAPSGTALTLAQDLLEGSQLRHSWSLASEASEDQLPVTVLREGDSIGEHMVIYESAGEIIQLKHEALSRRIFARGALLAARWLASRKGFYCFTDLFSLHF